MLLQPLRRRHQVHFHVSRDRRRCCCGSFYNGHARGWLMTIDNENLDMQLFHPWRRMQLQLPHHSALQCPNPPLGYNDPCVHVKIRKAAMSDDAAVVAVIHDQLALAFWRKGAKIWTSILNSVNADDVSIVIYHKGRLYVVTFPYQRHHPSIYWTSNWSTNLFGGRFNRWEFVYRREDLSWGQWSFRQTTTFAGYWDSIRRNCWARILLCLSSPANIQDSKGIAFISLTIIWKLIYMNHHVELDV